ncbi:GntR family transcriptional regulator [Lentisphaerota bacterium ZTH]|nr:GntR family transcriptional regulator [Lentisphaerota bacterium]WET06682.1 GntR family transcriptional regulator [Lentisphaerota bacterium ZTH]
MYGIKLNFDGGMPIYLQVVNQIKHLIASRRLQPGSELPPIRKLAQSLLVNPNTVVKAYKELERQGIVFTKRGTGTFISEGHSPLNKKEQKKVIGSLAGQLVTQAKLLNIPMAEIIQEIEKQFKEGA